MNGVSHELELIKPSKLSIDNVSKWFREGVVQTHALDRVSLTVDECEFVCLVGPSGCGLDEGKRERHDCQGRRLHGRCG